MSLTVQTPASAQAYLGILPKLSRRRLEVYQAVAHQEPRGATIQELAFILRAPDGTKRSYHLISPRISELVGQGWLLESPDQREGMTVYRVGDGSTPKARSRRARSKPVPAQVMGISQDYSSGLTTVSILVDASQMVRAPFTLGERVTLLVPRV